MFEHGDVISLTLAIACCCVTKLKELLIFIQLDLRQKISEGTAAADNAEDGASPLVSPVHRHKAA